MSELPYQAFMAHLPHEDHDEHIRVLTEEYEIGYYLIGYESEPYSHYHFVVQMTPETYHNYSKHYFKDKYNLRGKAVNGKCRQYGKLKEIKDLEKCKAYSIKDGNIESNMPQDEIQSYFDKSFKKKEKKKLYDEVHDHLEIQGHIPFNINRESYEGKLTLISQEQLIIKQIQLYIINYLRTTEVNMCRSNIMSYTQYHFKKTSHYEEYQKNELIYSLLF